MNNSIMEAVLAAFAEQREQNSREEDRRMAEIEQTHPDLYALVKKRHQIIMDSVRGAFAGKSVQDPEAQMEAYNQKIRAMLTEKGYAADYLSPVCICPICRDTGYVYDGAVKRVCSCLEKACADALLKVPQTSVREGAFEAFDESVFPETPLPDKDITQREYMRVVRDRCQRFARQIPGGNIKCCVLHGGSGLGKTYLLQCIGNDARKRGARVMYTTAYDLLNALRNAYFSRNGETADEYLDAELLLIDDLGMEPLMENVTVEQIYHLLSSRLTRGLYTAVSTNLSRTELKQRYTERVSSRLLDAHGSMAIPFYGKDIRLMK